MAGRKATHASVEPTLFREGQADAEPARAWAPRVFVTTDELRTCLSKHVLASWIDQPPDGGATPRPKALVAFEAPVAVAVLDALRARGPNTSWVGLELDPEALPPGATAPAPLPAVLPLAHVRRVVFASDAERDQFESTRMANVRLPAHLATADPTWFMDDARPSGVTASLQDVDDETAASVARRTASFRRLFGAAIAALDGTTTVGTDHAFLMGLTAGSGSPDSARTDAHADALTSPCNDLYTDDDDAAVTAWRCAAGLRRVDETTQPLSAVDQRVRTALIEHLRSSDEPTLDRERLLARIESAAHEASHDDRWRPAADRYPKAVANMRRLWRNDVSWENLLEVWPAGFPTLLAAMAMGSVTDADQYPVLRQRLAELRVPRQAAQLARLFFGLRWGIEAIPSPHRNRPEIQRFVEMVTWSTLDASQPTAPAKCRLERASGRQAQRPYLLSLEAHGAHVDVEIALAIVVGARFRRALRVAPDALQRAMVDLAADQPSARPYLDWKVRLPKNSYQTDLERGRAILSGPMSDGGPTIEFGWSDWSAFTAAVTQPPSMLGDLKRASDLARWEKAIEDVLGRARDAS